MEAAKSDSASWGGKTGKGIGWVIGGAFGYYTGIQILFPLAFSAAASWVGKKVLPPQKLAFLPSIAVQTGQALWITFGLLYAGSLDWNVLDVIFFAVGLTWLVLKPGISSIIFLTVGQVLSLAVNVTAFAAVDIGTLGHKALLVHILWRVMALVLMWIAYFKTRNTPPANPAAAA